ncbi:MAG: glycosyltransferase [Anaerolineaceae bacterium]
MKIIVCHVCSAHPADDGRVFERDCVSLTKIGYEVHLIAKSSHEISYINKGVFIHPCPKIRNRFERFLNIPKIANMARKINADIYHVHEPELLGAIICISKKKPVIWDVHEPFLDYLDVKYWIPKFLRSPSKFFWDVLERNLVKRSAAVIAVVDSIAVRYKRFHKKVVILRNFPNLEVNEYNSQIKGNIQSLVFTGTISPNRGLLEIIQALGLLKKKGVRINLNIAGNPINSKFILELLQAAKKNGVEDQIIYYGVLTKEDSIALQRKSTIGMCISNDSLYPVQGYPVKMFEFMQAEIPIIYSNFPSFFEIAGKSNCGIGIEPKNIFQLADAIEYLINNPEYARQLGKNGKLAIKNSFNWEKEFIKLKLLYFELVGNPKLK